MENLHGKGAISYIQDSGQPTSIEHPLQRPFKIQKLSFPYPIYHGPSSSTQTRPIENDSEPARQQQQQQFHEVENNSHSTSTEFNTDQTQHQAQGFQNMPKTPGANPFFYYQEEHVQESVNQCKNSLIGKILSEKPISKQILQNTLMGIWCNPLGFQITELEGNMFHMLMDKEVDIQRALNGNLWIIRNVWFLVHAWNRNTNVSTLNFNQVPLWIQIWGLPLHCKSISMGQQLGAQIGTVLDTGLYDYPGKARIIKVKVLWDINNPIIAGMHIGNDQDGITWLDFRYENLPMFCFYCGLVGHVEDTCEAKPKDIMEETINPRGAWLRSTEYGRRIIDKKDRKFSSNPMKSLSGGLFSPIPQGLLDMMADISLTRDKKTTNAEDKPEQHISRNTVPIQTGSAKASSNKVVQEGFSNTQVEKRMNHEQIGQNNMIDAQDLKVASLTPKASQML
jgi:hypothetical protein